MIRVESDGRLYTIVIDRPQAANALTPSMIRDLDAALKEAGRSHETRVVILRGAGGRAFSAGYDVRSIPEGEAHFEPEPMMDLAVEAIERCPRPVIAMIEGHCMGFACDLALACDLRVAGENARFAIPPARLGGVYPPRGIQRLLNTIGRTGAQELLLTSQSIDAQRAVELGMVQRVVAPESLLEETRKLAELVAENAPLALAATKEIVLELGRSVQTTSLDKLQPLVEQVRASADAAEGKRAFLEKRKPRFRGQ